MEKVHKGQLISSFHLKIRNNYHVQKTPIFGRFDNQCIKLEKKYKNIYIRFSKNKNYW